MLKNIFLSEKKLLNAILRALKQFCVLVQISKLWNARPQMLKNIFLSEKKLLCILRASKNTNSVF